MPVYKVRRGGKLYGFRCGHSGKLYPVSKYGTEGARRRAAAQCKAMHARENSGKEK